MTSKENKESFTKEEKRVLFEQIYDIRKALEEKNIRIPFRFRSEAELNDVIIKLKGKSRIK